MLTDAVRFDPAQMRAFVDAGWWNDDTLSAWLRAHAHVAPERPAIVGPTATISYGELYDQVQRLAAAFFDLGVRKGDVIAVQLPNIPAFLQTYLAVCALGGVLTTIHMPYRQTETETLLRHSGARAVVCLESMRDYPVADVMCDLKRALPALEHVIALAPPSPGRVSFEQLLTCCTEPDSSALPLGAEPFLLLYTSGTTSSPKGVPLTSQNMLSNARLSAADFRLVPEDVLLSAAPLSHLFGLYSVHLALCVGATNLLLPAFMPQDFAATIERGRATVVFTAPAHVAACLGAGLFDAHDISSLRLAIVSGSTCPPDLARTFAAKLEEGKLVQLWGMTEAQAGFYTRLDDALEVAAKTAGRPCTGNEVRIVAADGQILGPGDEGELHIRGCSIFPGYYDNVEANQLAFSDDGWFCTGDLAVLDGAGNVTLTGRSKDIINRGGVKFNPLDVETLLDQHTKIQQSALVPMPDPVLGEKACCFVVPVPGTTISLPEICEYLAVHQIAKNKYPERLEIIAEMPLTPTRKIIKGRLQALLQERR